MGNATILHKEMAQMTMPKKIAVSKKRQMTIPKEFHDQLQIGDEVLCEIVDGVLMIKPVTTEVDISEDILADLIREGYEAGDDMIREFVYRKSQLKSALQKLIDDTRDGKVYVNTDDLFADLEEVENE
ncbi:AbrB/MazE/SpoVT family DNA-binding domain-containing protein [Sporosarcina sp. FA9]|uniref:AbrB/MazE/SpoVT family DNA-binding domain-containing protein n=1 Tax=Sporosarcina sp. FA9 TaxID=3413030 RepID=UPI003F65DCA7